MSEPPHYWTKEKRASYRVEAIADELGAACPALDTRLRARIEAYAAYC